MKKEWILDFEAVQLIFDNSAGKGVILAEGFLEQEGGQPNQFGLLVLDAENPESGGVMLCSKPEFDHFNKKEAILDAGYRWAMGELKRLEEYAKQDSKIDWRNIFGQAVAQAIKDFKKVD